jgi:hypothetical protein
MRIRALDPTTHILRHGHCRKTHAQRPRRGPTLRIVEPTIWRKSKAQCRQARIGAALDDAEREAYDREAAR